MSCDGGKWINNADLQMKVKNTWENEETKINPKPGYPNRRHPPKWTFLSLSHTSYTQVFKATLAELIAIRSAMNPSNLPLVSIYAVRIGSYSLVSATKTLEFCTWCIETWTSDVTWRDHILKCWYVFPTSLVTSLRVFLLPDGTENFRTSRAMIWSTLW